MILVFIIIFCAIIALGFGGAAAWSDYSSLRIPNLYAACIGAAFIPAFIVATFLAPDISFFASWKSHLIAGGFVFALSYALFYFKFIGGGDSKLLSVYALWVGLSGLLPLFFFMALVGGVFGALTLALHKWKPVKKPVKGSWIEKSQKGAKDVPYGIAIFIGALVAFWKIGYLQPDALMALAEAGMGS